LPPGCFYRLVVKLAELLSDLPLLLV